jgi:hypothetical protein
MRFLIGVACVTALTAPVTCQPVATAADVAFLAGCWKLEAKGRVVDEQWMAPSAGALLGMSRTVVNGKIAEYEFLQIRELPEGLTYIAKPSNQPEARFVASSKTGDEVVFENPKHDFPQRIRYRVSGNNLHARIEGTLNGKARGVDYPYTRTPCPGAP